MPKIPVYFVPGLAASTRIFEYIQLPESLFNVHYIDWILPEPDDHSKVVPLLPIPNRTVKRLSADDSADIS